MINFEYEDVIEYLESERDDLYTGSTKYLNLRLTQLKNFMYNDIVLENQLLLYNENYNLGYWDINYILFQAFLRQKRINDFLKHTEHDKL